MSRTHSAVNVHIQLLKLIASLSRAVYVFVPLPSLWDISDKCPLFPADKRPLILYVRLL